jgi:hypothetical protein
VLVLAVEFAQRKTLSSHGPWAKNLRSEEALGFFPGAAERLLISARFQCFQSVESSAGGSADTVVGLESSSQCQRSRMVVVAAASHSSSSSRRKAVAGSMGVQGRRTCCCRCDAGSGGPSHYEDLSGLSSSLAVSMHIVCSPLWQCCQLM